MSRNEEEKREELFVWRVCFHENAMYSLRETVVREGMSANEERENGKTLQSDGLRIAEWATVSNGGKWREPRQVYSSVQFIIITSHDQLTWFVVLELECTPTKLNGSQFRQIYSSFSLQAIHSQTQPESTTQMIRLQTEVISTWAGLFIILFRSRFPFNSNEA